NTGSNDLRLDAAVESEPGRRETGDAPFAAVRRGPNGAERSGGGYAAADAREQRRRRIVRNGHGRKRSGLVEADAAGGQRRTLEEDRDGSCASSVGDRSIGIGPRVHECRAAGHEAAPVAVEEVEERNGATVAGRCGRTDSRRADFRVDRLGRPDRPRQRPGAVELHVEARAQDDTYLS